MLVLSRRVGEGFTIGDDLVVTLVLFTPEYVDLSLTKADGTRLGLRTIGKEGTPLARDIRGVFIGARSGAARLGVEFPKDLRFERIPPVGER